LGTANILHRSLGVVNAQILKFGIGGFEDVLWLLRSLGGWGSWGGLVGLIMFLGAGKLLVCWCQSGSFLFFLAAKLRNMEISST